MMIFNNTKVSSNNKQKNYKMKLSKWNKKFF